MEGEGTDAETLPEEFDEWVERRAAELETDRADVLARAVTALRAIDDEADASLVAAADGDAGDDLRRVEARVDDLEGEFDEKLADVRERVVQVKREVDEKAPADHDHRDIESALSETRVAAAEVTDRTAALEERVDQLDDRVTSGFENYEEVLSYLTDTTDETGAKLDAVARTLLDLRSRVAALESAAARDAAVADIRADANRRGVTVARCESCDGTVGLGLLDDPTCPHCDVTFDGLGPDRGLFKKPRLTTGTPPALAAAPDHDPLDSPADLYEDGRERAENRERADENETADGRETPNDD